jgi:hypothetical protein
MQRKMCPHVDYTVSDRRSRINAVLHFVDSQTAFTVGIITSQLRPTRMQRVWERQQQNDQEVAKVVKTFGILAVGWPKVLTTFATIKK